jgi:hypothetical protein
MTREEYQEYLKSEHWQEMRRTVLRDAGGRCQVCNSSERCEVHHRTYERVGEEYPSDLIVLCRACHEKFHGHYWMEAEITKKVSAAYAAGANAAMTYVETVAPEFAKFHEEWTSSWAEPVAEQVEGTETPWGDEEKRVGG